MQQIPLQAIPSQIIRLVLANQNVQLFIYQKEQGLFVDVAVNENTIVAAALALDVTPIVCRDYAGFVGNLMFVDVQGDTNPDYTGLADRYALLYLTESEYALFQ